MIDKWEFWGFPKSCFGVTLLKLEIGTNCFIAIITMYFDFKTLLEAEYMTA